VGRVHYIDEGEGRPIVFCHGQPMWSFLYRNIVIGLRDQFRCVAMDYPGYGLSVRPEGYRYTPKEHAQVVGELVDCRFQMGAKTGSEGWMRFLAPVVGRSILSQNVKDLERLTTLLEQD